MSATGRAGAAPWRRFLEIYAARQREHRERQWKAE